MSLTIQLNPDAQQLEIAFPVRIVSTNVGELKDQIFDKFDAAQSQIGNISTLLLIFEETLMLDSLGLNLLVSIIEWADSHKLHLVAHIKHDIIFNTLESVWLTQKMKVVRTDEHE